MEFNHEKDDPLEACGVSPAEMVEFDKAASRISNGPGEHGDDVSFSARVERTLAWVKENPDERLGKLVLSWISKMIARSHQASVRSLSGDIMELIMRREPREPGEPVYLDPDGDEVPQEIINKLKAKFGIEGVEDALRAIRDHDCPNCPVSDECGNPHKNQLKEMEEGGDGVN